MPDILIGSAAYSSSADNRWPGIAAVYLSPRDPRRPHPAWYRVGDIPGVPISCWLYPAGDVNGDGLADLALAQAGYPSDADQRGRCSLFLGQRLKLLRWRNRHPVGRAGAVCDGRTGALETLGAGGSPITRIA